MQNVPDILGIDLSKKTLDVYAYQSKKHFCVDNQLSGLKELMTLSAPFTGHANHFLEEAKNQLNAKNVYTVGFEVDSPKVPLTRSLTKAHLKMMNDSLTMLDTLQGLRKFLTRPIS